MSILDYKFCATRGEGTNKRVHNIYMNNYYVLLVQTLCRFGERRIDRCALHIAIDMMNPLDCDSSDTVSSPSLNEGSFLLFCMKQHTYAVIPYSLFKELNLVMLMMF